MSNIVMQRTDDDHIYTWLKVKTKHEMGQETTEYWSASILMWQFRLLYPRRTWGITRDKQGCHHLPPTPQPEKGHHAHLQENYPHPPRTLTLRINKHRTWAYPKARRTATST
jgi:hypothetical protein